MNPEDVIDYFGGVADTARALNISYQAVKKWVDQGKIPVQRQYQIQVMTDGELTVEPQKLIA